jgi:hypothetical protein
MKRILAVLAVVYAGSISAAEQPKEVYVQLDHQVQLVLTNGECMKWKADAGYQLNYAYAVNLQTGDKVDGCFSHEGDVIHVELADESNNLYSYKIKADNFIPRPSL